MTTVTTNTRSLRATSSVKCGVAAMVCVQAGRRSAQRWQKHQPVAGFQA